MGSDDIWECEVCGREFNSKERATSHEKKCSDKKNRGLKKKANRKLYSYLNKDYYRVKTSGLFTPELCFSEIKNLPSVLWTFKNIKRGRSIYYLYSLWGKFLGVHYNDSRSFKRKGYSYSWTETMLPNEVFNIIIANNFDIEGSAEIIEGKVIIEMEKVLAKAKERDTYKYELEKLEKSEEERNIRQRAEKDFYGKVRNKRDTLSAEQREDTFEKFNHQCAICGEKEGLHIHHKDKNPQNNDPDNLILVCSVCHKKIHMKVK